MIRACWFCKTPIHACFGFCLGRDYVAAVEAQAAGRAIPRIRELCGICVEKAARLLFGEDW